MFKVSIWNLRKKYIIVGGYSYKQFNRNKRYKNRKYDLWNKRQTSDAR